MESTFLGLVVDSSCIIAAERRKQPVTDGAAELSLSAVTVAELVHGLYRTRTRLNEQIRLNISKRFCA